MQENNSRNEFKMDDKDSIDYYEDIPIDETDSVDSFTEIASKVKDR